MHAHTNTYTQAHARAHTGTLFPPPIHTECTMYPLTQPLLHAHPHGHLPWEDELPGCTEAGFTVIK